MWPDLVVVSTPILHFHAGVVKAHKPMRVQALGPKLAVEGFNEAVVGWFAGSREVQTDIALIRPQIKITRNELRTLVHADGFRVPDDLADTLQRLRSSQPGYRRR